jgi:hypothetical protein
MRMLIVTQRNPPVWFLIRHKKALPRPRTKGIPEEKRIAVPLRGRAPPLRDSDGFPQGRVNT